MNTAATLAVLALCFCTSSAERTFKIDYDSDQFLKDGAPFRYIGGSIHYYRVVPEYWHDRILRLKAAGMNAISINVNWNVHEEYQGQFNFTGIKNITKFLQTANELDMVVILRVGPFTCGKYDNGGLPWWLFKIKDLRSRSSDPRFLRAIKSWYNVLLPMMKPLLYKNGGPIVLVQIEKEYSATKVCDHAYMAFLRDQVKQHLGDDIIQTTVDPPGANIPCGIINGTYMTVETFSTNKANVKKILGVQRKYAPKGPFVMSEFYAGWFSAFGDKWQIRDTAKVSATMSYMYDMGASFNFYMGHGGTNFGYGATGLGSKTQGFTSITTSYDYDGPVSEDGVARDMFKAVRAEIEKLSGPISTPVPPDPPLKAYGDFPVFPVGVVLDILDMISPQGRSVTSKDPLEFEDIDVPYGFVLYQATAPIDGSQLTVKGIADRGYLLIDSQSAGIFVRHHVTTLKTSISQGQVISILVENQGRSDGGFGDRKGILSKVVISDGAKSVSVQNWTMYPIEPELLFTNPDFSAIAKKQRLNDRSINDRPSPTAFVGQFTVEELQDTYFNTTGWGKGQFFLNGFNVGRYWPKAGPQMTLYIPKPLLQAKNKVVILELEHPNCEEDKKSTADGKFAATCKISFIDHRVIINPRRS